MKNLIKNIVTVGVVCSILYFLFTAGISTSKESIILEIKDGTVQAVHTSEDLNIVIVEYASSNIDTVEVKFQEPDSIGYTYKEIYQSEPEVLKGFEKLIEQRNK